MRARPAHRSIAASRWLRLAIAVLSVVVGLGVTLPAYARMVGGPKDHACHCDTGRGHAHCECPICFPDLEPSIAALVIALESRCGDDDPGWRTSSDPAVAPAELIALLAQVIDARLPPPAPRLVAPCADDPPDPRPPRIVS